MKQITGRKHQARGFTLTEIMIVIVIVAVLTALAFPSYQQYVLESSRSEAHANLMRIADMQERFFIQNNGYGRTLAAIGFTDNSSIYDFEVTASPAAPAAATSYAITAKPQGSQAKDTDCKAIFLDSAGERDDSGTPDDEAICW